MVQMKPTSKNKKDFSDQLLDKFADHILRKIKEIEEADEASTRKELRRQISDQLIAHFIDSIDKQIEGEIKKARKPKNRLEVQQEQIWQIAKREGSVKGIARLHVEKLIERPLKLSRVKATIIYNWIIIGPKLFEGAYNKKSNRGRVLWACSIYEELRSELSIPEISDYLSKVARHIYGKKYDKRTIERALHRHSSQNPSNP